METEKKYLFKKSHLPGLSSDRALDSANFPICHRENTKLGRILSYCTIRQNTGVKQVQIYQKIRFVSPITVTGLTLNSLLLPVNEIFTLTFSRVSGCKIFKSCCYFVIVRISGIPTPLQERVLRCRSGGSRRYFWSRSVSACLESVRVI